MRPRGVLINQYEPVLDKSGQCYSHFRLRECAGRSRATLSIYYNACKELNILCILNIGQLNVINCLKCSFR